MEEETNEVAPPPPPLKRFDPRAVKRPARPVLTETFASSIDPESGLTLTLQKMDSFDEGRLSERQEEAKALYITGTHEICRDGKPLEIPGLTQEDAARLTPMVIRNAAAIEIMQPASAADRRDLEELILIALVDRDLWAAACDFGVRVNDAPLPKATIGG